MPTVQGRYLSPPHSLWGAKADKTGSRRNRALSVRRAGRAKIPISPPPPPPLLLETLRIGFAPASLAKGKRWNSRGSRDSLTSIITSGTSPPPPPFPVRDDLFKVSHECGAEKESGRRLAMPRNFNPVSPASRGLPPVFPPPPPRLLPLLCRRRRLLRLRISPGTMRRPPWPPSPS